LIWYTRDPESNKPELYARYWGRMVNGKFEGPVNVHAKGKTHHAIFINGTRMTRWTLGTAPTRANAQWQRLVAKQNQKVEFASTAEPRPREPGSGEPEAPAAGPVDETSAAREQITSAVVPRSRDYGAIRPAGAGEERRPKIDIDDSLRLLAFPPRTLRQIQ
jgi:hypothetical protein